MLRGIWAYFTLGVFTVALSLPVVILVPLVPRWSGLSTVMARLWSRIMLRVVGARVTYHDPDGAVDRSNCVFIANHCSNVDIWALARVLPAGTRFVAKQELFRIPVLGWAMAASGFISIDRSNRAVAIRSLSQAAEKIRDGHPVILFPEGTRSRDGRLKRFKKGAFHLALQAGVPIIPVAIKGTFEIMPPGSLRVRPGPVDVFFEPAVDVADYEAGQAERLSQTVRAAIVRRLGGAGDTLTRKELAAIVRRRIARDPLARTVRDVSRASGVPAWLVGGYVRDAALGRSGRDLDLAAGPRARTLIAALEDRLGRRGFRFTKRRVTTWRFAVDERRLDVVDAGTRGLREDLRRRELTINAVAYDLVGERILDPLRGLADLRAGRLRMPRPGVIREDPLRALRAARFLAELPEFTLNAQARSEARSVAPRLCRESVERVREELDKLLASAAPQRGLSALTSLGIADAVLPELAALRDCRAGGDRPDVWSHSLEAIAISARPFRLPAARVSRHPASRRLLRWSLLLHDISKPETLDYDETGKPRFHGHEVLGAQRAETLLSRLRLPRSDRRRVCRLVLNHLRPGHLAESGGSTRGLRRLVHDSGDDLPLLVLHAACDARASGGPADPARWRRLRSVLTSLLAIDEKRSRHPLPRLIDGHLLVDRLGIKPGPLVGRLLSAVRVAQEEGRAHTRDEALALAESLARLER